MGSETLQFVLPLLVIALVVALAIGSAVLTGFIWAMLDNREKRRHSVDLRFEQIRGELFVNVQSEAEKRGLVLGADQIAVIAKTELARFWKYRRELLKDDAPTNRRSRLPSVSRFLDLLGLLFPPKTRERIYTAYAEELKEDHSTACKRYRTKGAKCWVKFCTGWKICLLLATCIPAGIIEKLGFRARKVISAILEDLCLKK